MSIKCTPTKIPEVVVVEPLIFSDDRGYFLELYHQAKFKDAGVFQEFVQDNFSRSTKNTLRGLHYQKRKPQAKLVTALCGLIFDVAVDLRPQSPTFGNWVGELLSGENKRQMYIPAGFAHGFCVLSENAEVFYKCSDFYDPTDERGIRWSDPILQIAWPVQSPIVSPKDRKLPFLQEVF